MSMRRPETESELVELVRSIDVSAPRSLHERIDALVAQSEQQQAPRARPARVRRWRVAAAGGALAVAAAVLILLIGGSGSGTQQLSVSRATALTQLPASMGAPGESTSTSGTLNASVDGVAFPYWEHSFGWRSSGARVDSVNGRTVRTVFYSDAHGRRVGYAIVSGSPAPSVTGGQLLARGRSSYRLLTVGAVNAVVWERGGRLCVLASRDVSPRTLLALASWGESKTV
jgi:hypothetical protein